MPLWPGRRRPTPPPALSWFPLEGLTIGGVPSSLSTCVVSIPRGLDLEMERASSGSEFFKECLLSRQTKLRI